MEIKAEKLSECWIKVLDFAYKDHTETIESRPSTGIDQNIWRVPSLSCSFKEIDIEAPVIKIHIPQNAIQQMLGVYTDMSLDKGHSYAHYITLDGHNQINWVIDTLKLFPYHRRAYVSFQTNGNYIEGRDSPPCINVINFALQPNSDDLIISVVFSAQDLYRKFIPDISAVVELSKAVEQELSRPIIKIQSYIINPVINNEDSDLVSSILKGNYVKR